MNIYVPLYDGGHKAMEIKPEEATYRQRPLFPATIMYRGGNYCGEYLFDSLEGVAAYWNKERFTPFLVSEKTPQWKHFDVKM